MEPLKAGCTVPCSLHNSGPVVHDDADGVEGDEEHREHREVVLIPDAAILQRGDEPRGAAEEHLRAEKARPLWRYDHNSLTDHAAMEHKQKARR